jgi:sugar phosphate isomerase/epimerase
VKLSYTTLSVQEKTLAEAAAVARAAGLDGIELRGKDNVHISPQSGRKYIREAKKVISGAGLEIPCLTAYTAFFQPDREQARKQGDALAPMLELAAFLGAATVRTFMGAIPRGMGRRKANSIAAAGLNYAVSLASGLPVKIVIETHDSVKNGALLAPLLDELSPQAGVLLDIIHPWDTGETIGETLGLIGKRIYHIHIKDIAETVPGGRVYSRIGEGRLEVEHQVRTLLDFGYGGFFSLEWEQSAPGTKGVSFNEQLPGFVSFMRTIERRTV